MNTSGLNATRAMSAAVIITGLLLSPTSAAWAKQGASKLVGTWTIATNDTVGADGKRTPTFGPNPKGTVIFDRSGHYALELMRADMPKIASNNRLQGTPDENKAVTHGLIAHFGKYSVNEKGGTLVFHIDGSSFPNWNSTEQKRSFTVKGDELKWTNSAASGGGTAELVWKRVK